MGKIQGFFFPDDPLHPDPTIPRSCRVDGPMAHQIPAHADCDASGWGRSDRPNMNTHSYPVKTGHYIFGPGPFMTFVED